MRWSVWWDRVDISWKNQKAPATSIPYIYITTIELKLELFTHTPRNTWVVPQSYACSPSGQSGFRSLANRSSCFLLHLGTIEIQVSETIPHPYNPNIRMQDLQPQQRVDMDKEPFSVYTFQIPWSAFWWEEDTVTGYLVTKNDLFPLTFTHTDDATEWTSTG